MDKLVEPAELAFGGSLLIKEGKAIGVKFLEKLLSGDLLQAFLAAVTGEIDSQDSGIFCGAGPFHPGRFSVPFFHPVSNELVIDREVACLRFLRSGWR